MTRSFFQLVFLGCFVLSNTHRIPPAHHGPVTEQANPSRRHHSEERKKAAECGSPPGYRERERGLERCLSLSLNGQARLMFPAASSYQVEHWLVRVLPFCKDVPAVFEQLLADF